MDGGREREGREREGGCRMISSSSFSVGVGCALLLLLVGCVLFCLSFFRGGAAAEGIVWRQRICCL